MDLENSVPVSCMPPPESPAKRMTTLSSSSTGRVFVAAGALSEQLQAHSPDCPFPVMISRVFIGPHPPARSMVLTNKKPWNRVVYSVTIDWKSNDLSSNELIQ